MCHAVWYLKFEVAEKSDRMIILLKGKVAVFKFRDDVDTELEREFYNKSKRIIGSLIGNRPVVPFSEIIEDFDKKSIEIFSKLSGLVAGSIFLFNPSHQRQIHKIHPCILQKKPSSFHARRHRAGGTDVRQQDRHVEVGVSERAARRLRLRRERSKRQHYEERHGGVCDRLRVRVHI